MNKEDLIELREIFRKKFEENDFCIGREQVERVFRELLGEPEPKTEYYGELLPSISSVEISKIIKGIMTEDKIKFLFERDDMFYKNINRK